MHIAICSPVMELKTPNFTSKCIVLHTTVGMKGKPSVLSPSKEPPPSAQYQSDLSSAKTMLIILGLPSNFSHVISLQKWREMVRIFYIIWFIFWCWMERTRISGGGHLISVGFGQLLASCAIVQPPFYLSHCTSVTWQHCTLAAQRLHFVTPPMKFPLLLLLQNVCVQI